MVFSDKLTLHLLLHIMYYLSKFPLLKHSFTWLVVEEAADTSLGSVEESCCHGVILSICTEQLEKQIDKIITVT